MFLKVDEKTSANGDFRRSGTRKVQRQRKTGALLLKWPGFGWDKSCVCMWRRAVHEAKTQLEVNLKQKLNTFWTGRRTSAKNAKPHGERMSVFPSFSLLAMT